jgi:hypothetical protein
MVRGHALGTPPAKKAFSGGMQPHRTRVGRELESMKLRACADNRQDAPPGIPRLHGPVQREQVLIVGNEVGKYMWALRRNEQPAVGRRA